MSIFISVASTRINVALPKALSDRAAAAAFMAELRKISSLHGISEEQLDPTGRELSFTIRGSCSSVAAARLRHVLQAVVDNITQENQ